MTTLKYTGTAHFREIGKADLTRHGVDNQGAFKVARHDIFPEHNWKNYDTTVDVSDEAAEWLLANEPGEWAVVEDKDAEASKSNAPAGDGEQLSGDGQPTSSPDASDAPDGVGLDPSPRTAGTAKKASSTRTS